MAVQYRHIGAILSDGNAKRIFTPRRPTMARPDLCISSDSHVVETPDIFDGLEARFGDLAPRIVFEEGKGDILHVNGRAGLNIGRFGIAGHFANDPETVEMMRQGYRGLRKSIVDPMERLKDQKVDG